MNNLAPVLQAGLPLGVVLLQLHTAFSLPFSKALPIATMQLQASAPVLQLI